MAEWNHNICERCWFTTDLGLLPDGRFRLPMRIKYETEDKTGDVCCHCGTPTVSGIYTRAKEDTLLCQGDHDNPDHWSPFIDVAVAP